MIIIYVTFRLKFEKKNRPLQTLLTYSFMGLGVMKGLMTLCLPTSRSAQCLSIISCNRFQLSMWAYSNSCHWCLYGYDNAGG